MTENELFLAGVKPALLKHYRRVIKRNVFGGITPLFKELSNIYPYIVFEHRNGVLFFQNQELKDKFIQEGLRTVYDDNGNRIDDYYFDKLGLALGYPPLATEYFNTFNNITDIEEMRKYPKVRINYYGMQFVCSPNDIADCLEWLKQHRPIPLNYRNNGTVSIDGVKTTIY